MRPAFPLLVARVRVTLQCRNDLTVLHFAVHQNHTAIGLLLLQHSADALAKDVKYSLRHRLLQNLSTPLSTARSHRNRVVPLSLLTLVVQWKDSCGHRCRKRAQRTGRIDALSRCSLRAAQEQRSNR